MVEQLEHLARLGAVILVAGGAMLLLIRLSGQTAPQHNDLLLGYPLAHYPAHALTRTGTLAELAAIQARLVSVCTHMPAHSDLAIWVRAFLRELREIMDTAYHVAVVTQVYGQPIQLEQLVAEVRAIELEVAEHVTQQLLARGGDIEHEPLNGRLATLRLCVRELARLPQG